MNMLHVATWNLDGYGSGAARRLPLQINALNALRADVLVLTEVRDTTRIPGMRFWWSSEGAGPYAPQDRAVCVASAWEGYTLEVADPRLSVCVVLGAPTALGQVVVYGTIIPYAMDGVRQGVAAPWERHRRAVADVVRDLERLRAVPALSSARFVLAGDFNTCLDGSGWYGDPKARLTLVEGLERVGMLCHTLENIRLTRGSDRALVDHVWASGNLKPSEPLHVWCDRDEPRRLSDHNGVALRLGIPE